MARPVDSNTLEARKLSMALEEMILLAHSLGGDLTELHKKVDFCLEHGTITPSEAKTLKNNKLMSELADEIYH